MPLADEVRALREERELSQRDLARQARVSQRTVAFVESGGDVKLATLRQIIQGLRLDRPAALRLIVAWIRQELGEPDFRALEFAQSTAKVEGESSLLKAYRLLPARHRAQLLLALDRSEVLDLLAAANSCWDHDNDLQ